MTPMTHIWLHNPQTDGYWEAPEGLVNQLVATGAWERCEGPVEYSHATAEHAAWRDERARLAEAEAAAAAKTAKSKPKAAASGESEE